MANGCQTGAHSQILLKPLPFCNSMYHTQAPTERRGEPEQPKTIVEWQANRMTLDDLDYPTSFFFLLFFSVSLFFSFCIQRALLKVSPFWLSMFCTLTVNSL